MNEYPRETVFYDWDKYCVKAREVIAAAGLNGVIDIDPGMKGRCDDRRHVYINKFPVKGNMNLINRLSKIKEFHGYKSMGFDRAFYYRGWIVIEEV